MSIPLRDVEDYAAAHLARSLRALGCRWNDLLDKQRCPKFREKMMAG